MKTRRINGEDYYVCKPANIILQSSLISKLLYNGNELVLNANTGVLTMFAQHGNTHLWLRDKSGDLLIGSLVSFPNILKMFHQNGKRGVLFIKGTPLMFNMDDTVDIKSLIKIISSTWKVYKYASNG